MEAGPALLSLPLYSPSNPAILPQSITNSPNLQNILGPSGGGYDSVADSYYEPAMTESQQKGSAATVCLFPIILNVSKPNKKKTPQKTCRGLWRRNV